MQLRFSKSTGDTMNNVRVIPLQGVYALDTPFDHHFKEDLKLKIPSEQLKWDGTRKMWLVGEQYGDVARDLIWKHYNVQITMPPLPHTKPQLQIFEVRYLGASKLRRDGSRSAYAYCNGGWNVVFPEDVLIDWFVGVVPTKRATQSTTYYEVLGIRNNVKDEDIKPAYRRMARQWHPDVCHEPDATRQFQKIQEAYEVLSNNRARYDAGLQIEAMEKQSAKVLAIGWSGDVYRAPLRCGLVLADATQAIKTIVQSIKSWEDIVNNRGQVLVSSWPQGLDTFIEEWV